jgi:hypothetical protein
MVQANVAVNTKLTSKVPFLFGNFDVFKKNLVKNVPLRYGMTGKLFSPPPPRSPLQSPTFPKKIFRCLFNIQKCPWKPVPPLPIFWCFLLPCLECRLNAQFSAFSLERISHTKLTTYTVIQSSVCLRSTVYF